MTRASIGFAAALLMIAFGADRTDSFQTAGQPAMPQEKKGEDEGLPVRSALVRDRCSACHKVDEKGRMTRISYRRAAPEGWQQTMRRMVALNNLQISPEEARAVVRYLATYHGLAPEEARPAAFEAERRMIDYKYAADKDTERTCSACHSMGRVIAERRTKDDWGLLVAMHRGFYPYVDFQAFRRVGPPQREPGPDGRPPDNRQPMDKAIEHLSGAFPLQTPDWSAWSATMRTPQLEGRWALVGYQPGKGHLFGEVAIAKAPTVTSAAPGDGPAGGADTDFTTEIRYVVARTGESMSKQGKAIVYAGFQWRGRSTAGADERDALREVMFVERDWRRMTGRWFGGGYDELGVDVTLTRIGREPMLLGTARQMLTRGARGQQVRLFGVNLPSSLSPADFDFGPGVKVGAIVSASPELVVVEVAVDADAVVGARDVFLAGSRAEAAVAVFDKIDAIKIAPQAGLARLGGVSFPKQFQQFEAIAYSYGPDGKPDTKDDVKLGLVDASWSVEEFTATFDDDDRQFVGAVDQSGLFTPNVEGPNPERRNNANNYGDVWVVASYAPPDAGPAARPLRGRAHLLVTVPLYMRWDALEGSR